MSGAFAKGLEGLWKQGSRAGYEQARAPAGRLVESRMLEQAHVEGRHAHEHGCPGQMTQHLLCIELRQQQHRRPALQHAVAGDEETVGVEDGQRVEEHVIRPKPPGALQDLGVGSEVAMTQHRPLRSPGGAGGVQQRRRISVRADDAVLHGCEGLGRFGQSALAVAVEAEHFSHPPAGGDRLELRPGFRTAHEQRRLRVGEEVVELGFRVGRIEGEVNEARTQTGEVEEQGAGRLVDLHRHSIPFLQSQTSKVCGNSSRFSLEIGVAEPGAGCSLDEWKPEIEREAGPKAFVEIGVHEMRGGDADDSAPLRLP